MSARDTVYEAENPAAEPSTATVIPSVLASQVEQHQAKQQRARIRSWHVAPCMFFIGFVVCTICLGWLGGAYVDTTARRENEMQLINQYDQLEDHVEKSIDALKTEVATLARNSTAGDVELRLQMSDLADQSSTHTDDASADIVANARGVSANAQAIEANVAAIEVNAAASTTNAANIANLQGRLATLQDRVASFETAPPALHTVIPGADFLGRAFRLDSGTLGPKILEDSFAQQNTFTYAFDASETQYSVPDAINLCSPWRESGETTTTQKYSSIDSWRRSRAARLGVSASLFSVFTAGLDAEANDVRETLSADDTAMFESKRTHGAMECVLEPNMAPFTSESFQSAAALLPNEFDASDPVCVRAYSGFFAAYGAYVVNQVQTGGQVIATVTMSDVSSLESRYSGAGVNSFASAQVTDWLRIDGANVGGDTGTRQMQVDIRARSSTRISVVGGDRTNAFDVMNWSQEEIAAWTTSVRESPKTVYYRATPISAAMSDIAKALAVDQAIVHFYGTAEDDAQTIDQLRTSLDQQFQRLNDLAIDNQASVEEQQANLQSGVSALNQRVATLDSALSASINERVLECRVCFKEGRSGTSDGNCRQAGTGGDEACSGWSSNPSYSELFFDRSGYCFYSWKLECR